MVSTDGSIHGETNADFPLRSMGSKSREVTHCKTRQQNNMTTQNPLDSPEARQQLFYPRTSPKTDPPAGAENIDVEVEPGITIGCRLFTADKQSPTILYFHGNGEIVSDYDDIGPMYTQHNINLLVTEFLPHIGTLHLHHGHIVLLVVLHLLLAEVVLLPSSTHLVSAGVLVLLFHLLLLNEGGVGLHVHGDHQGGESVASHHSAIVHDVLRGHLAKGRG